jgi:hypothetical protein
MCAGESEPCHPLPPANSVHVRTFFVGRLDCCCIRAPCHPSVNVLLHSVSLSSPNGTCGAVARRRVATRVLGISLACHRAHSAGEARLVVMKTRVVVCLEEEHTELNVVGFFELESAIHTKHKSTAYTTAPPHSPLVPGNGGVGISTDKGDKEVYNVDLSEPILSQGEQQPTDHRRALAQTHKRTLQTPCRVVRCHPCSLIPHSPLPLRSATSHLRSTTPRGIVRGVGA